MSTQKKKQIINYKVYQTNRNCENEDCDVHLEEICIWNPALPVILVGSLQQVWSLQVKIGFQAMVQLSWHPQKVAVSQSKHILVVFQKIKKESF